MSVGTGGGIFWVNGKRFFHDCSFLQGEKEFAGLIGDKRFSLTNLSHVGIWIWPEAMPNDLARKCCWTFLAQYFIENVGLNFCLNQHGLGELPEMATMSTLMGFRNFLESLGLLFTGRYSDVLWIMMACLLDSKTHLALFEEGSVKLWVRVLDAFLRSSFNFQGRVGGFFSPRMEDGGVGDGGVRNWLSFATALGSDIYLSPKALGVEDRPEWIFLCLRFPLFLLHRNLVGATSSVYASLWVPFLPGHSHASIVLSSFDSGASWASDNARVNEVSHLIGAS